MNKLFILICCLFLTVGCAKNDWFDAKTDKSLTVPSGLTDLQALLDNANLFNSTGTVLNEVAADASYFSEEAENSINAAEKNCYIWSKEDLARYITEWDASYQRVYTANLVLETVAKIEPVDTHEEEKCKQIRGQALFFRAKAFYDLSQVFVPYFSNEVADEKLGVPLRLESDVMIKTVRSTVRETYDRIIGDLSEAMDLLPLHGQFKTSPSKIAAYALFARIYLGMEKYEEAGKYADMALSAYNTLIDYNTLSYNSIDNPFTDYNPEIIFYCNTFGNSGYFSRQYIFIYPELYHLYDDHDLRKKVFFIYEPLTNRVNSKGSYAASYFEFFSGLATDELYLIRSECYARAGKTTEAMNDLNTLLKTRWEGTYTDVAAADADEALEIILTERKKELVLRNIRWSDLRRLNRDPRFASTLTRSFRGQTYILEPGSLKYTLPIPDDAIEMSGLAQNPGWQ